MPECIPLQDGVPYVQWIYYIFGDCVYGTQATASLLLGYLSIVFWLNAQLPQVIENYKKSSAESLSLNFLAIWLVGDVTNLIGCILTHQLPFQKYLGIYFVCVDVCLVCQWIYYSKIQHHAHTYKRPQYVAPFQHPSAATPLLIESKSTSSSEFEAPNSVSASPSKWYTMDQTRSQALGAFMLFGTKLSVETLTSGASFSTTATKVDNSFVIGMAVAWVCTCFYLTSRIPQIRKNYKRRSVEGLSLSLFICAAGGNLTYFTSVVSHPGQTKRVLLGDALPYLLGSAGTLVFDATIAAQFFWYRRRENPRVSVVHLV